MRKSVKPIVFIARAAAPTFSALAGETNTMARCIFTLFLSSDAQRRVMSAYYASRIYNFVTAITEFRLPTVKKAKLLTGGINR
jgi:hypothetical protein